MAFLTAIADQLNAPGGLWEFFILKVFGFVANYGWRMILFVVALKLVMLPLDIFQRVKMRKNERITKRLAPQLEKLQQQYAGDKQALAQKQMELNRREGFSYFSSCLPMIVTMAIFFYLFSGLQSISQFMNLKQYAGMYDRYSIAMVEGKTETGYDAFLAKYYDPSKEEEPLLPDSKPVPTGKYGGESGLPIPGENDPGYAEYLEWIAENDAYTQWLVDLKARDNALLAAAQDAVVDFYENESKESFLWVKNIWSPDVPWTKPILTKEKFMTNIAGYTSFEKVEKKLKINQGKTPDDPGYVKQADYDKMLSEYDLVTDRLYKSDTNKVNGLLILPILSVGLSFLSQFITSKLQKKSGQTAPQGGMASSMKVMMLIMPLMMGFFALQYTTAFTLYIVLNSAITILINVFASLAMGSGNRKEKREKKNPDHIVKYGRPDPKDL